MTYKAEGNPKSVSELAELVEGHVLGDATRLIYRVASLDEFDERAIVFIEDPSSFEPSREIKPGCFILPIGAADIFSSIASVIEVARPKLAYAIIGEALHPAVRYGPSTHPTAVIAHTARIAASAYIGAYVQIDEDVEIGERTQVHAGTIIGRGVRIGNDSIINSTVTLYERVDIGDRVILHAGVVAGADGFGFVRGRARHHKFPQIGITVIEDEVEIGANTCIDRGALGETRIGRGTKIDNLVHIAHNVRIGERVVIAAQTGISGSTVVGDDAVIGGQVGIGDHVRIESGVIIGSKAGILPGKIVRAGSIMWGIPVRPLDEYKRLNALWGRLPEMRREIKELRSELEALKKRLA